MHKLKITNCKSHLEELTLTEGNHTIGRSMDSTLRLEGQEVSRLHARLLIINNRCEIIDENSKNGTFINGKRIKFSYLYHGDAIQIGKFNIQFISDTAKPHILNEKKVKSPLIIICLITGLLILSGFFYYQKSLTLKSKLQLAERTAQYLSEKNKEALYLGEYDSINLLDLPKEIKQAAVWDRRGNLRVCYPLNSAPTYAQGVQGFALHRNKNTLEIYAPIYYESTQVGMLWLAYRL